MMFDVKSFLLTIFSILILSIFANTFKLKEYFFPFGCALLGLVATILAFSSAFLVKVFFVLVLGVGLFVIVRSLSLSKLRHFKDNISLWPTLAVIFAIACAVFLNIEHFPTFRYGITESGLMWSNFFDSDTFHKSLISSELIRSDSWGRILNPFYWPSKLLIHHIGGISLVAYGDIFSLNKNVVTYAGSNWLLVTASLAYLLCISSEMFFDYLKRLNLNINVLARLLFIVMFSFIISLAGGLGKYYSIFSNASHNPESWWGSFFLAVAFISCLKRQYRWAVFFILAAGCFKISLAPSAVLIAGFLIFKKLRKTKVSNILMCLSPLAVIIFIGIFSILDAPNISVATLIRTDPYFDFSDVTFWTVRVYREIFLFFFAWIPYGYSGISLILFSLFFPLFLVFSFFKISTFFLKETELVRFFKIYAFFLVLVFLPVWMFETHSEIHSSIDPWITNILMSRVFVCLSLAFFISVSMVIGISKIRSNKLSLAILITIPIILMAFMKPDMVAFVKRSLPAEAKLKSKEEILHSGSIYEAAIQGKRLSKNANYKFGFAFSIKEKNVASK